MNESLDWFKIEDIGLIQLEISNYCNAACPLCNREDEFVLKPVGKKQAINN